MSSFVRIIRIGDSPIVPACEMKLFSIWENALDGVISYT